MTSEDVAAKEGRGKALISQLAWPLLLTLCLCATAYGFAIGWPVVVFNLSYLSLALILYFLELKYPFESSWLENDGQTFANIAPTVTLISSELVDPDL